MATHKAVGVSGDAAFFAAVDAAVAERKAASVENITRSSFIRGAVKDYLRRNHPGAVKPVSQGARS